MNTTKTAKRTTTTEGAKFCVRHKDSKGVRRTFFTDSVGSDVLLLLGYGRINFMVKAGPFASEAEFITFVDQYMAGPVRPW